MKKEYTDGFFNVSKKYGFLPTQIVKDIPSNYKLLVDLCNELPILKKNNQFGILHYPNLICEKVKELPNLRFYIEALESPNRIFILQTLFRYYSFLTSSYCLEHQK